MFDINGYELLEKIGEGGMSTVWKARQLSLDRLVAIKIMGETSLPDREARDWFRKEAQNAARLNHPHIVQIFDTGEVDGKAYIVMEHVQGHNVGDEILSEKGIAEARALVITEQVARALAYAWEKECLIHCDIKPDNLLVDGTTGNVKVADLGVARLIGMRSTGDDEMIIGTPNYTAPEQSAGLIDLDCRTDMYALGATLYHMATGTLPFRGASGSSAMTRHEQDFLEDPQVVNPSISAPTAWLIEKLMTKNRALRPHFWTQVLKDIEAVRRGQMPFPPLPEPGTSTIRRAEGRKVPLSPEHSVPVAAGPASPPKLTLKRSALPAVTRPPTYSGSSSSGGKWFVLFLLVLAIAAVLLHREGKLPVEELLRYWPVKDAPVKEETGDEPVAGAEVVRARPTTEAAPPVSPSRRPEVWHNEDFVKGAALFNQALSDYKEYQQTRANPAILAGVEQKCRTAIAHFEACRDEAPPHLNISDYISRCYGIISNVRQSTTLDMVHDSSASTPSGGRESSTAANPAITIRTLDAPPPSAFSSTKIVFVDDEPDQGYESAPATNGATSEESKSLLRLAFDPSWSQSPADAGGIAVEIHRLLARLIEPSSELKIDASVILHPEIHAMMSARDAARIIGQELPVRRVINTPGLPANSMFYYEFEGSFGWANRLTLVVDRIGRVIMSELYDDRLTEARFEPALYAEHWSIITFVNVRRRAEGGGLVAHRVRSSDGMIRIETEQAATPAEGGGPRMVVARSQLLMPVQLAGLILQTGQ